MAPTLQRWPHGGGPPRDLGEQGLSQGNAGAGLGDGVISSLAPYRLSWPVAHRFGLLLPPESRVGLWAPGSADPQRQVRRGWASGREPFALGGMCCTQNAALISAPATAGITSSPTPAPALALPAQRRRGGQPSLGTRPLFSQTSDFLDPVTPKMRWAPGNGGDYCL